MERKESRHSYNLERARSIASTITIYDTLLVLIKQTRIVSCDDFLKLTNYDVNDDEGLNILLEAAVETNNVNMVSYILYQLDNHFTTEVMLNNILNVDYQYIIEHNLIVILHMITVFIIKLSERNYNLKLRDKFITVKESCSDSTINGILENTIRFIENKFEAYELDLE